MDARNHTLQLLARFEHALGPRLRVPAASGSSCRRCGWRATSAGWPNTGSPAIRSARWARAARPTACAWPRSSPRPTAGSIRGWRRARSAGAWRCPRLAAVRAYLLDTLETHARTAGARARRRRRAVLLPHGAVPRGPARRAAGGAGAGWRACRWALPLPAGGAHARAAAAAGDALALGWPDGRLRARRRARAHEAVHVPEFEIDAQPVSWAQFVEFIDDGGYDRPELWHAGRLGVAAGGGAARGPARSAPRGADRRGQRRGAADAVRPADAHGRAPSR